MLDLNLAEACRILNLGSEELNEGWRLKTTPTRLQEIGRAISRQRKISAIRYPSWAAKRLGRAGWNLAIFPSALEPPDRLEILGDTEIPLEVLP